MNSQDIRQFSQENLPPEITKMTLEEFLESGLEECEYIKGKLVPMLPNSLEHGRVRVNLILPLGLYVRENRLGRVYGPFTEFRVGECILVPDIAFLSNEHIPDDRSKMSPVPPDLAVEVVSPTDVSRQIEEKCLPTLRLGRSSYGYLNPDPKR